LENYTLLEAVSVEVTQAPWERLTNGHRHGFTYSTRNGYRKCFVIVRKDDLLNPSVTSGITDFRVLKTTKSGYEGFLKDKFTKLPETKERILATAIDCSWSYDMKSTEGIRKTGFLRKSAYIDYDEVHEKVIGQIKEQFFGDTKVGVYSPSVQATLYDMGAAIVTNVPPIKDVKFTLPNIHFIPMTPNGADHAFNDDVYIATSEPHGTIKATVSKDANEPVTIRSKL